MERAVFYLRVSTLDQTTRMEYEPPHELPERLLTLLTELIGQEESG
jgi:hypothetical protein